MKVSRRSRSSARRLLELGRGLWNESEGKRGQGNVLSMRGGYDLLIMMTATAAKPVDVSPKRRVSVSLIETKPM